MPVLGPSPCKVTFMTTTIDWNTMQYRWRDHLIDIPLRSITCWGFQKIYLTISSKRRWHPNFLRWIPSYTMWGKWKKSLSRCPNIGTNRHQIMKPKILLHEDCTVRVTPHVICLVTISFKRNLKGRTTGDKHLNSLTIARNCTNRYDRRRQTIYCWTRSVVVW